MLNYLGAAPQPQMGATMPGGIPGSGTFQDPTISPQMAGAMASPPMMVSPSFMPGMMGQDDPAAQRYLAVTQEDGSVLLHMKNADGSPGPAVKIIPPIKRSNKQGG